MKTLSCMARLPEFEALVLLLISPEILGRLPYTSVLQFSHLQHGDGNCTYLKFM